MNVVGEFAKKEDGGESVMLSEGTNIQINSLVFRWALFAKDVVSLETSCTFVFVSDLFGEVAHVGSRWLHLKGSRLKAASLDIEPSTEGFQK